MKCIIAILLLVSRVVFADPPADNTDNALLPFWVVHPGTSKGGCDDFIDVLKESWEEACLEARQAINDLNFLRDNHNNGAGPDVANDRNGADRWTRVYNLYLVLFGNPVSNGQFQVDHLIQPRVFFEQMVTKCSTRSSPLLQQRYLYCNDDYWDFIKIGSPDPEDATKKIEVDHPQCKPFGGVWHSLQTPPDTNHYADSWEPPIQKGSGPLCGGKDDHHIAVTTKDYFSVTWCLFGLKNSFASVDKARANIKAPKVTDAKDAKKKIQNDELTLLYKLAGLENRGKGDMPSTWVHEIGHLLRDFDDEPAFDEQGQNIFGKGPKFDESKSSWVISKTIVQRTYSWEDCVNLARKDPSRAAKSPENLANFATASYLSDWDWRYGYAQPPILHP